MARLPPPLPTSPMNPSWPRLAFVDLETTGATAAADRITEVGIVEVDETGVHEWSSLVNPGTRISEFIERLTGISNAMVAGAPSFSALAPEIAARLEGRLFIAHNASFDYGFLKAEFQRAGLRFRAPVLCTVKLSRRLFPQFRKHSLDSLIERHGLSVAGRHRALADAQAIHQFWRRVHQELDALAIDKAVAELTAGPKLPPQLDAAALDDLPEGPGVYLFYGENELPLYVGRGKDIRQRVLAHFSGDKRSAREAALLQELRRIDWRATDGEIGALLVEAELIKQLQPAHNPRPHAKGELCSWQLSESGPGLWQPRLLSAGDVDLGRSRDLFGLFKSAREARKVLEQLAEEFGLCHGLLGLEQVRPGRPCFAHQMHKCRGACVGKESPSMHSGRLMAALAKIRLKPWPFGGAAKLREGDAVHVIDGWRYRGTARTDQEVVGLMEGPEGDFDADIYKVLVKLVHKLTPCGGEQP
jgi:DNA polymerase-3 subunit epsilon